MMRFAGLIALSAWWTVSAHAGIITFDFEGETATYTTSPYPTQAGGLTTLTLTNGGISVTITRPGSAFDIDNNTLPGQTGKPAGFGSRSLDPFFDPYTNTPFVLSFSKPITSFSVDWGDYYSSAHGSDNDILTLKAYSAINAGGSLLNSTTSPLFDQEFPNYFTTSVAASGIRSVTLLGGGQYTPNSVFYDNFKLDDGSTPVEAVPAPPAWALLAVGGLIVARRRRQIRRA